MIRLSFLFSAFFLSFIQVSFAGETGLRLLKVEAAGLSREALVHVPADAAVNVLPLVFVFHGHGGTMANSSRTFSIHLAWPEALVVYPQGIPTPGRLTDPEGKKSGWQSQPGDQQDRDLAFFDVLLKNMQANYAVDSKRVYSTGHSNGGGFTYLLWAMRGDLLAAVAPSGAARARSGNAAALLQPKPAMHLAGENDPLVKFAWQEASMKAIRQINGCEEIGTPWDEHSMLHISPSGTPFVSYIHPGGHEFPRQAVPQIVRFFQENPAKEISPSAP
jgi:polyhydroxybutyrate depolymerase